MERIPQFDLHTHGNQGFSRLIYVISKHKQVSMILVWHSPAKTVVWILSYTAALKGKIVLEGLRSRNTYISPVTQKHSLHIKEKKNKTTQNRGKGQRRFLIRNQTSLYLYNLALDLLEPHLNKADQLKIDSKISNIYTIKL